MSHLGITDCPVIHSCCPVTRSQELQNLYIRHCRIKKYTIKKNKVPAAVNIIDLVMFIKSHGLHAVGERTVQNSDTWKKNVIFEQFIGIMTSKINTTLRVLFIFYSI